MKTRRCDIISKQEHLRNQNCDIWGGFKLGRIMSIKGTVDFESIGSHVVRTKDFTTWSNHFFKFKTFPPLLNNVHFDLYLPIFRFGTEYQVSFRSVTFNFYLEMSDLYYLFIYSVGTLYKIRKAIYRKERFTFSILIYPGINPNLFTVGGWGRIATSAGALPLSCNSLLIWDC